MADYIHISKLDAAKRQLEMAIRLFLGNEDIVSIHTLTAAAHEVLRNLCSKQGKGSFLKDTGLRMIKPEKISEFLKMMNEPENFFKHANKDPEAILKFYIGPTEMLLWDVVAMYQQLTQEVTPLMRVYYLWYFSKYPDVLMDSPEANWFKKSILEFNLDPNNRAQFLSYLNIASTIGIRSQKLY